MGLLSWILLGLVAGALARFLMPGSQSLGVLFTIGLGIAGALVGGFLASAAGLGSVTGFDLGSVLFAMAGALILLFLYQRFNP